MIDLLLGGHFCHLKHVETNLLNPFKSLLLLTQWSVLLNFALSSLEFDSFEKPFQNSHVLACGLMDSLIRSKLTVVHSRGHHGSQEFLVLVLAFCEKV
jgi:hypothetical protein